MKTMAARVPAEKLVEEPAKLAIVTIFKPLVVVPHVGGTPRNITGEFGDLVPVTVMRVDKDHGIVARTAAKRACTGVKHAVLLGRKLAVEALLGIVIVVPHKKPPGHVLVLRGIRMKSGYLVFVGLGIAAGLKKQHLMSCDGQVSGYRSSPCPRTHDDVFILGCHLLTPIIAPQAAQIGWVPT